MTEEHGGVSKISAVKGGTKRSHSFNLSNIPTLVLDNGAYTMKIGFSTTNKAK